jgi:hypothetical protein
MSVDINTLRGVMDILLVYEISDPGSIPGGDLRFFLEKEEKRRKKKKKKKK